MVDPVSTGCSKGRNLPHPTKDSKRRAKSIQRCQNSLENPVLDIWRGRLEDSVCPGGALDDEPSAGRAQIPEAPSMAQEERIISAVRSIWFAVLRLERSDKAGRLAVDRKQARRLTQVGMRGRDEAWKLGRREQADGRQRNVTRAHSDLAAPHNTSRLRHSLMRVAQFISSSG